MLQFIRNEKALIAALLSLALFFPLEHTLLHLAAGKYLALAVLFGVITYAAMGVAHHAEILAIKYGEPYGTMILTISAVTVEIVIIAMMMAHSHNPTLARDTVYSAIMLDFNGLLGIAALIGGIKHGEQAYNIDSTNSYLSMILVAVVLAMVVPHFIASGHHATYEWFSVFIFIALYFVFTRIQVKEHRYFFQYKQENEISMTHGEHWNAKKINGGYHALLLLGLIVMIGLLSELFSLFLNDTITGFGLPLALGAFVVAVISASPELITAVRSAAADRMQTVVNIALGASLSTVLLTVPAVIVVAALLGFEINLALEPLQILMITLTVLAGVIHFNDGKTNLLEGFVHLVLFIAFVGLMFMV